MAEYVFLIFRDSGILQAGFDLNPRQANGELCSFDFSDCDQYEIALDTTTPGCDHKHLTGWDMGNHQKTNTFIHLQRQMAIH